jgi:hypothetical protein
MLKIPISNIRTILSNPAALAREHIGRLHERIAKQLSRILPEIHTDITATKQEIWTDLSRLYYKYDNPHQKTAFREVIKEISQTITEDRWPTAYKRIYRNNKTTIPLASPIRES